MSTGPIFLAANFGAAKTGLATSVRARIYDSGGSLQTTVNSGWTEATDEAAATNTGSYYNIATIDAAWLPIRIHYTIVGQAGVAIIDNPAVSDKANFALAAAGLDQIVVTDPGGISAQTTFPKMVVALWRRFFKKTTATNGQVKTYAEDGTTVNTTQAVTDDGTTQTQGASS